MTALDGGYHKTKKREGGLGRKAPFPSSATPHFEACGLGKGSIPGEVATLELRKRRIALAVIWDLVSEMSGFLSGCRSSDLCIKCWPCHAKMYPGLSKGIQIISFFLILPPLHCGYNALKQALVRSKTRSSWSLLESARPPSLRSAALGVLESLNLHFLKISIVDQALPYQEHFLEHCIHQIQSPWRW